MKTSEDVKEIAKALSAMQSAMETAVKKTEAFKYKYSDLSSVWEVLRAPMTANGLCVVQDPVSTEDGVSVYTRLMHISGQWMEFGPLLIPMGKRDAHSTGSAITYAKRYALCAALGVVTEDDDGQEAQKAAPKTSDKSKHSAADLNPISSEQHMELESLLGFDGGEELRRNVLRFIKSNWGRDSLAELPSMLFESVAKKARKQAEPSVQEKAMGE